MIKLFYYVILLLNNNEIENMVFQPDFQEISSNQTNITLKTTSSSKDINERMNIAFKVALEKLLKKNGTLEIVVQTGEAFGRGIFYEFLQKEYSDWTMEEFLNSTIKKVFSPIGTSFNIAEISDDKARSLITQYSFDKNEYELDSIASFFTYGFIRGLLLSAFPKGELLIGDTLLLDVPLTEYIFKANASTLDKSIRNSIKNLYTVKKN